jgi:UDP-N-acetylmuramate: L-alanyl-gamma-D-glutamyl-meso-diaminopimelate ligase
MKQGTLKEALLAACTDATRVCWFDGPGLGWSVKDWLNTQQAQPQIDKHHALSDLPSLVAHLTANTAPNEHIVVMSNGGFGGVHGLLIQALHRRFAGQ